MAEKNGIGKYAVVWPRGTRQVQGTKPAPNEPAPEQIIFTGNAIDVNEHFYAQGWSDGLPISPPTVVRVQEFLKFTDRAPQEVIGVLPCEQREATVWNVAVNGVMAGCRPEYMPILLAIVEAMAEPGFGLEYSGNSEGGEALIILDGPIVKQLGFNYEQGALRAGYRPNTSIGRFYRLYLMNVAGFGPQHNDQAAFGGTWKVVLAENVDFLAEVGWQPLCADMGVAPTDNAIILARYSGGDTLVNVFGDSADKSMPYMCHVTLKSNDTWHLKSGAVGKLRPLVVLSPAIAEPIVRSNWSKQDVRQYLFDHVRLPAWEFEQHLYKFVEGVENPAGQLTLRVAKGELPRLFAESDDPNRMVPIVTAPDHFMIAISGDPGRDNGYLFSHNGVMGYPTCKKIKLPAQWDELLCAATAL
jgi:hypothetical protein